MGINALDKINLKLKIALVKSKQGRNIENDLLSIIEDYNDFTIELLKSIKRSKGE